MDKKEIKITLNKVEENTRNIIEYLGYVKIRILDNTQSIRNLTEIKDPDITKHLQYLDNINYIIQSYIKDIKHLNSSFHGDIKGLTGDIVELIKRIK